MPIAETLVALKGLTETIKALSKIAEVADDVKVHQAVIELNSKILDVQGKFLSFQSEYDQLAQTNRDLKSQLEAKLEWERIAGAYGMKELKPGIFAFENRTGTPKHFLCPNCWVMKKPSILQRTSPDSIVLRCHACSLEIVTDEPPIPFEGKFD